MSLPRCIAMTVIAVWMMSGCTAVGNVARKTGKIIRDPSIPVGHAGEQPTTVSLSMHASLGVNPNPASMDAPVLAGPDQPERFSVSLSSGSEEELAVQMRATLQVMEAALDAQSHPWLTVQPVVRTMQEAADAPTHLQAEASERPSVPDDAFATGRRELGQYDGILADARSFDDLPVAVPVATPVRFKVIQLRDDAMFLNADFGALGNDLKKALGSTWVADDDYVMQPGQFKFIDFQPVREGVHFIAVVAMFHDIEGATWKRVFRIRPLGHRYPLLITFDSTTVDVVSED